MIRDELSLERQLVLMASVEMDDLQGKVLEELLNCGIKWSEVLYQMVTHRTLNMLRYNLNKFKLLDSIPAEIKKLLDSQWQVYGERNRCYLQKLREILVEFEKGHVIVPVLKGNMLASKVYPEIQARGFNDLDLLMKLEDLEPVTKALEGLGYLQGHYDEENKVVVEASRKEKVLHQMASHEVQEFQKVDSNPFASLIQVDVNYEITWKGNCPFKVPTADLISRAIRVEINGVEAYMLDYIDNIIQLSCHLYKEATLMMWITSLSDLKIYKFADLFMFIKKYYSQIDWEQLVERVQSYKLEKVIYYNFHYIEMMFGEIIPRYVLAKFRPEDLTYLDEYAIENEKPSLWKYDFFTRLFDTDRVLSIDKEQAKGMKRFLEAKVKADGVCLGRTVQV